MNAFPTMTVKSTKRTKLGLMAPKKLFFSCLESSQSPSEGTHTGQVLTVTPVGKGWGRAADSTDGVKSVFSVT